MLVAGSGVRPHPGRLCTQQNPPCSDQSYHTVRARTGWLFDLWGPAGGIANASDCTHAPHHNNSISVRYSMFAIDAPGKSQLAIAISMLAGYRTEPQHLWSAGPVKSKTRVPLFAARTLNATGQSPGHAIAAVRALKSSL